MDDLVIIYETVSGSHLYGTNIETSDTDYRGVCLQPIRSIIGLQRFEQREQKTPDRVIFGIRKFIELCLESNPNILEILFAPTTGPTCITVTPGWEEILKHRHFFLSKKSFKAFNGYAMSQLHRIKTHYKWMAGDIPPVVKPEDFGAVYSANGNLKWTNPIAQSEYKNAHDLRVRYETWVANRNPARHELEKQFGYDTKHGMHLLRLGFEGSELLSTGVITLPRPEAKFLVEVRKGLLSYLELLNYFEQMQSNLTTLLETSPLPELPDYESAEQMLMEANFATVVGQIGA